MVISSVCEYLVTAALCKVLHTVPLGKVLAVVSGVLNLIIIASLGDNSKKKLCVQIFKIRSSNRLS